MAISQTVNEQVVILLDISNTPTIGIFLSSNVTDLANSNVHGYFADRFKYLCNKNAFGQKPTTHFGIEIKTLTIRFWKDIHLKITFTLRWPWPEDDFDLDGYINTVRWS